MLRSIVVAAALFGTISVASAAPFTNATCEAPRFEAFMHARLGTGKNTVTGKDVTGRFNVGPIVQSETVSNTGDKISCQITFKMDTPSGMRLIRGRFTATRAPNNGRGSWRFQQG